MPQFIATSDVPKELFMVHTPVDNEVYLDETDAWYVKNMFDESYKAQGLSKRTPMYRVTLDYEIYDGS